MSHPLRTTALMFSLCAVAIPASANNDMTRWSDNGIDLSVGASHLRYGESAANSTLDTETGWMPSVGIGAGYLASDKINPEWMRNIWLRGDFTFDVGQTHYNGALQNLNTGATTPYQSTTNDDIITVSGKLGRAFALSDSIMLTPFADLGFRYWVRDLTGTGGYSEYYHHGQAMVGAMIQFSPLPDWVFSLSGEGGTTFAPKLEAIGSSFALGSQPIWQTDAKIGYAISPNWEATGSFQMVGFNYGSSPIVNGAYEPYSSTHQIRSMLGIAYHMQK